MSVDGSNESEDGFLFARRIMKDIHAYNHSWYVLEWHVIHNPRDSTCLRADLHQQLVYNTSQSSFFARSRCENNLSRNRFHVREISLDFIVELPLLLPAGQQEYSHFDTFRGIAQRSNPTVEIVALHLNAIRALAWILVKAETFLERPHETLEHLLITIAVYDCPHVQIRLFEHSCLRVSVQISGNHIDLLPTVFHLHVTRVELLVVQYLRVLLDIDLPIHHRLIRVLLQSSDKFPCLRDSLVRFWFRYFSKCLH